MIESHSATCTAFDGFRCVASGDLLQVAHKVKEALDQGAPPARWTGNGGCSGSMAICAPWSSERRTAASASC